MFDLTPGERRGALVLLALCALAALNDLAHLRSRPAPPVPEAGFATVSGAESGAAAGSPPAASGAAAAPLDLNRATAAELDGLPGIGPVLAGRIVAQRSAHGPYRAVDELLAVQGIGPRLVDRLRPLVRAEASRTGADATVQDARPNRR